MTTSFTLLNAYDLVIVDGVKQSKPANKNCRLYLVLTIERGKQKRFKTDLMINATKWDFDRQQVRSQVPDSTRINRRLAEIKSNVLAAYNKLMDGDTKPTFDELCRQIDSVVKTGTLPTPDPVDKPKTFFEVFDLYIEAKKDENHPRTVQKIETLKKQLRKFQEVLKKKSGTEISFDTIDLVFYDDFIRFLHSTSKVNPRTEKKGLSNDTQAKYIENLKQMLKWSHKRKYHSNMIYLDSDFSSTRKAKHEILALSKDDMAKLHNLDLTIHPHLERVRDLFLFMVYTGQRWSDYENFNPNDIDGNEWILTHDQKVGKPHMIPLYDFGQPAFDILQKYNGKLPKMTDQAFNRSIKTVCEKAELTDDTKMQREYNQKQVMIVKPKFKFVSAHTARRTCITHLLDDGMPPTTVMLLTGHSDLRTMMKYVGRNMDTLRRAYRELGQKKQESRNALRAV